ncbi:MAG: 50S ribosomal protein L11 [Euryarchaeota archaeon CG01_land_8_20_14_3_00_38_12]|nr:MAG: 50S ribosomal protein L11 [Euryarchaeota archaeon CG01_land_8_20_14_3_00_38_12]
MTETVEALVEGGKATPGPPLGPALGPLGVNIPKIIQEINEKTKNFEGMKVPVKIIVDPKTKSFEISVGTPPASALILKEVGVEKGTGKSKETKTGNLTMEQVKKIVEMKKDSLLGINTKNMAKEIVGTCVSVGVTVESKDPKEILKEIDEGKHDEVLKG